MEDVRRQIKKLKAAPSLTDSQIDVICNNLAAKGIPATLPRRDDMPRLCDNASSKNLSLQITKHKVDTESWARESYIVEYQTHMGHQKHIVSMVGSRDKDCSSVHRAEGDMGLTCA